MNRLYIIICFLFVFGNAHSQNINWKWARVDGPVSNMINGGGDKLATYSNNSIYAFGNYYGSQCAFDTIVLTNNSPQFSDLFLTKYDSSGNVLWVKSVYGNGTDLNRCVATQYNGNIYLSGTFNSDTLIFDSDTLFNTNGRLFFAKYDANGNLIWVKNEGGPNGLGICFSIATDIVGFYATGAFHGSSLQLGTFTLNNLGTSNIFLAKFDLNGNFVWAKSAGGNLIEESYFVARDLNDNAYIAGISQSTIAYFGTDTVLNPSGKSLFVAKYDPNGNSVWVRGFPYYNYSFPYGFANDNSGNMYFTGYYDSTITFGNTVLTSTGNLDAFLAKIDTAGNVVWAQTIGDTNFEIGSSIIVSPQGKVFLAGTFYSYTTIGSVNFIIPPSQNPDPMFVATFDTSGSFLCVDAITSGGDLYQSSFAADNMGNVYLGGSFQNTSPMIINFDTLSQLGGRTLFLTKFSCNTSTGVNAHQISDINIKLFPNPTTGKISIDLERYFKTVSVKVFSVTGKEVFYQAFNNKNNISFYLNASSGFYFVEVAADDISFRTKVVVAD